MSGKLLIPFVDLHPRERLLRLGDRVMLCED